MMRKTPIEVARPFPPGAGFPCSARYQPGNPQNSIVVAEEWSGLRMGLPAHHVHDNPGPIDMSHFRPGRG